MASLIPALSEKAKHELLTNLPRIAKEDLDENTFRCGFMFFEAFQDLFDLEKYPITQEDIFNYLKRSSVFELVHCEYSPNKELKYWVFKVKKSYTFEDLRLTKWDSVDELTQKILRVTMKRDIDIIGDIHGWWEKPQTY